MVDGVIQLMNRPNGMRMLRELCVRKFRGSSYVEGFHFVEEMAEGSFIVGKAYSFLAPHPMTFMVSVSIVITEYPAVILLA